jgi:NAD(P)-dependent dehydrogenase (short-subunit alcohol dehydrogenase family)
MNDKIAKITPKWRKNCMARYLDYLLQGKSAIVTGAGSGIGRACALELAKGGANLTIIGRRAEPLEQTARDCAEFTRSANIFIADVADADRAKSAAQSAFDAFGRVDILINNAGIESSLEPGQSIDDLFDTFNEADYLRFFQVHAWGHYNMSLAAIPYMQKNRFGRVVNITSVTGVTGQWSSPPYTASKAAAILQTKAFAKRYGADNITFNSISPGMVNTPMKSGSTPEEFAYVAGLTPLGHVAEPIEIARAALFFAQEHLFVTGQNLIVDGGSN